MSIVIDTVGACLVNDHFVVVRCRCGREAEPDLLAIAVAFGEQVTLGELQRRLKCRHCHHKGVVYIGVRSGAARRVPGTR
jgi:hypothetical protein